MDSASSSPSIGDLQLLPPLDELSNRQWVALTSGQETLIKLCQTLGLLPWVPREPCSSGHNNWKLGANSRALDQYAWRCVTCRSTRTLRDNTFFSYSKLTLQQVMALMFYWSQGLDSHIHVNRHCEIKGDATIVDWKNFLRDVCVEYCLKHTATIGGPGHIVEIDESAWAKRKYNRGRSVGTQWVFGGIDRDTRECFAVTVDRRDAATLLPIIQRFILPGTTILSDQWAAYNNISSCPEGYQHQTVNHSLHFVDPDTHAHTQNIENMWMCIKRKKKQQMGQHTSLLPTHLAEFMWRRKFGDKPFENLVKCIRDLYPVA